MDKVIVSGACGFVGGAVVRELLAQGKTVYAVIRDVETLAEDLKKEANLYEIHCDMADYPLLKDRIPGGKADVFYHFAWDGSAGPRRANEQCQLENVRCSCEAVRAAKALGCSKFIFAGSIMEYEIEAIMQSNQAPGGSTLYSSAKKAADYFCRTLANTEGIDYTCGLISNIYGPGENSPRLINTSIRKILNGEETAFSAGDQMYDFIYIDDAARIFAALGEKGKNNHTYYIGSLTPRPLKEFLVCLRDVIRPEHELGLGKLEFKGVSLTYQEFDVKAVQRDTGVVPQVSFEQGIRNTMDWIRNEGR